MRQIRILGLTANIVLCILLLAASCTQHAEEPAQAKVKPQKTSQARVESEEHGQTIKIALKFNPGDSTTYKVISEADKSIIWQGAESDKPKDFTGGHTGRTIETTFTQQIQSIDDKGNAEAKITIKQLKYVQTFKNDITIDFDSSKQQDGQNQLSKLIGQSYTIEITTSGEVSKLIDVNDALSAVKGDTSAEKLAANLLSLRAIKERHTIPSLPASGKNQLLAGDKWSSIQNFSFEIMGSKSYEKIYTLKEIKDLDNRLIAVAQMEAVPSTEKAKELHKEQSASIFANMSDNKETFTGELRLDLTAGKIEECSENLTSEWIIVDPNPKEGRQPAALIMTAVNNYSIEKID